MCHEGVKDLITLYKPSRNLRSSDKCLLAKPFKSLKFGHKSFHYSAPVVWNFTYQGKFVQLLNFDGLSGQEDLGVAVGESGCKGKRGAEQDNGERRGVGGV